MKHEVEVILKSKYQGVEIVTVRLRYWRAIHSELMTHRVFSRNASSSRAIPVKKMLQSIAQAPAGPVHWGKNQPGMQADEECYGLVAIPAELQEPFKVFLLEEGVRPLGQFVPRELAWNFSAWLATRMAGAFSSAGYHKQVVNRITEPYQYINTLVTSTEWENFYALRCHPDAMPEIRFLAESMRSAISSAPTQNLPHEEWHLPWVKEEEKGLRIEDQLKLSVARSASVSFRTVDNQDMTLEKAQSLYDKLVTSTPAHASPLEHQAMAYGDLPRWGRSNLSAPWMQYRKIFENFSTQPPTDTKEAF